MQVQQTNKQRVVQSLYSQSHLGWHFRELFKSSKLKARKALFTEMWQKRRSSFELWALKEHSKISHQVGLAVMWSLRSQACKVLCRFKTVLIYTARSREDETRNEYQNTGRNPRWWKLTILFKCAIWKETCDDHRGFRFVFQWPFRVSSSRERAVTVYFLVAPGCYHPVLIAIFPLRFSLRFYLTVSSLFFSTLP